MASRGTRYTYFNTWGSAQPPTLIALGLQRNVANIFIVDEPGYIVGCRYYRHSDDDGEHYGAVRTEPDNQPLGVCSFKKLAAVGSTPFGWQHAYFRPRVPVDAGTMYNICVFFSKRRYRQTTGALTSTNIVVGHIELPGDTATHWNGNQGAGISILDTHAAGVRFGIDVLYLPESAL